nr:hypothetical protein CFP56_70102 [Quercus suber]
MAKLALTSTAGATALGLTLYHLQYKKLLLACMTPLQRISTRPVLAQQESQQIDLTSSGEDGLGNVGHFLSGATVSHEHGYRKSVDCYALPPPPLRHPWSLFGHQMWR